MGIHKVIKLTLLQFPKIIPAVFAAVFQMIDSFRDFKAPLLINHCLRGRCKRAEGTWSVHGGGGAVQEHHGMVGARCKGQQREWYKKPDGVGLTAQ